MTLVTVLIPTLTVLGIGKFLNLSRILRMEKWGFDNANKLPGL